MILAVDIGTSSIKAGLFSLKGKRISFCESPMPTDTHPANWTNAFVSHIRQTIADYSGKCTAICICGQGPTLIAADSNGNPLGEVLLWTDRRAQKEASEISRVFGKYYDASFFLPKILWIKNQNPGLYERCAHFLSCPEFFSYLFTGNPVTVIPGKGYEAWFWSKTILNTLALDHGKFPEFVEPGACLGSLTAKAANMLGMNQSVKVFAAGPDFLMAILGTGTVKPGQACDRAGTSEGINLCAEQRIHDNRLFCYTHIVPDFYIIAGILSSTGGTIDWYINNLANPKQTRKQFILEVESVIPGAENLLFLPYLVGERSPIWDANAKAVFFGLKAEHSGTHMARAVVESTGFAVRHVIETMEENRVSLSSLRTTGGPSKSHAINQIKADITNRPVQTFKEKEAGLLGCALIALCGLGEYNSFKQAASAIVEIDQKILPNTANKALYDDLFQIYKSLYPALKESMHKLS